MIQLGINLGILVTYGFFVCLMAYLATKALLAIGMSIGKGIAISLNTHIKDSFNQIGDNNKMNINLYFGREK